MTPWKHTHTTHCSPTVCAGVRLEVSYLAQHTQFGHRGHIYPTQTKDKKALPYKGLWVCAETRALFLPRSSSPSAAIIQAVFPPQGSGILPFITSVIIITLSKPKSPSVQCILPEHTIFLYFFYVAAHGNFWTSLFILLHTRDTRGNSWGFEADSHDLRKFTARQNSSKNYLM